MKEKCILITIDGMRPDGFLSCGNDFANEMLARGSYTLRAGSVFPPVTLPAHLSLFHSIPPVRHGTMRNEYMPPVHTVNGLFEQIKNAGGRSAMFYGWEPIRDIARPKSLKHAEYIWAYTHESTDSVLTDRALIHIEQMHPDFVFLYLVETDEKGGHDSGWMTEEYLHRIHTALNCVKKVLEAVGDEYTVIVTADHGGHDRTHGLDIPEDMTIPMFFFGKMFEPGKEMENVTILDLAPTIADILEIPKAEEWEGKSLLR